MNDTGTMIAGLIFVSIAGVISLVWLFFPFSVLSRLKRIERQGDEANAHLAVISHQITVQNRRNEPPVQHET